MRFNLEVHLETEIGPGLGYSRGMRRGEFTAKSIDDIPNLAYQWIKKIKFETGYRKTIIEKVLLNNEHDITDEVRELDESPIPDLDLPF